MPDERLNNKLLNDPDFRDSWASPWITDDDIVSMYINNYCDYSRTEVEFAIYEALEQLNSQMRYKFLKEEYGDDT